MEWFFDAWGWISSNGREIFWVFLAVGLISIVPTWVVRGSVTDWDRDYGPMVVNAEEMTVAEQVIAHRIADQTSLLRTITMWLGAIYMVLVLFGLMIGATFFLK